MGTERPNVPPARLARLFRPASVANVGASERHERSRTVIENLVRAQVRVFLVNPNRPSVFGRETVPSVRAIGEPVDARSEEHTSELQSH